MQASHTFWLRSSIALGCLFGLCASMGIYSGDIHAAESQAAPLSLQDCRLKSVTGNGSVAAVISFYLLFYN